MLDRQDDSPWSERRATRPPAALVIDGRWQQRSDLVAQGPTACPSQFIDFMYVGLVEDQLAAPGHFCHPVRTERWPMSRTDNNTGSTATPTVLILLILYVLHPKVVKLVWCVSVNAFTTLQLETRFGDEVTRN